MPGEAQDSLFQAFGHQAKSIYLETLTGLYFAFCGLIMRLASAATCRASSVMSIE
jgi:hypothetical protein